MKRARNSRRHTVIVDFGRGSIKLAEAESAGEAVRFRGMTRIQLPRDEAERARIEDGEIAKRIGAEVQRLGWGGMPTACLLSGSATSTQSFLFPAMPDADLRQAIELKLGETLHFDVDEACFDYRKVRERSQGAEKQIMTLVAAAKREAIDRALRILRSAGLRPAAVGAASESLANLTYYASLCHDDEATIHVDIGADSTILNLFEGRLLRFSREVRIAGEAFTHALMRPIITASGALRLSYQQADEVKRAAGYPIDHGDHGGPVAGASLPHGVRAAEILPLMEPVAQQLTTEIRRSVDYLRGILKRTSVDRIVLSGSGARMRNLDVVLEENLETQVACLDPVARAVSHWRLAICDEDVSSPAGFSAILGFSLGNHRPINLLPREERLQQTLERVSNVRKATVPTALAFGATMALAAVPVDRGYGRTSERMRDTRDSLGARITEEAMAAQDLAGIMQVAQGVADARGAVPDWHGIFKELGALLPDQFQLESLRFERSGAALRLHLDARVHSRSPSFERVLLDLNASPFFTDVRLLDASLPSPGSSGRFEASLSILARSEHPLTTQP